MRRPATAVTAVAAERVGGVDHDAAIERAACLEHARHRGGGDGHEDHFRGRHSVGDGGRVCAVAKFRRQRPRPSGVPRRERDVMAGGVPKPPYRRAHVAGSKKRDLHSLPLA